MKSFEPSSALSIQPREARMLRSLSVASCLSQNISWEVTVGSRRCSFQMVNIAARVRTQKAPLRLLAIPSINGPSMVFSTLIMLSEISNIMVMNSPWAVSRLVRVPQVELTSPLSTKTAEPSEGASTSTFLYGKRQATTAAAPPTGASTSASFPGLRGDCLAHFIGKSRWPKEGTRSGPLLG